MQRVTRLLSAPPSRGRWGALFLLGAQQRSGADAVLELAGFDALLARAELVITGEGKLDEQTLQGKGPAEVARRARTRPGFAAAFVGGSAEAVDPLGAPRGRTRGAMLSDSVRRLLARGMSRWTTRR